MDIFREIEQIYKDNYDYLNRFLLRMTKDEQLSEDIVQETFTKILIRPNDISNVRNMRSWLTVVARNTLIDFFNKSKDEVLADGDILYNLLVDAKEPSNIVIKDMKIEQYLSTIPKDEKLVFIAREYYGYTYKEMGILFDLPVSTIKSRLFRVRRKLIQRAEGRRKK